MKELAGRLSVGLNGVRPALDAFGGSGVKHVSEIVGQVGEVPGRDVQPHGAHTRFNQTIAMSRIGEAGHPPNLVPAGQGPSYREGDLPSRPGDENLLAVQHSHLRPHSSARSGTYAAAYRTVAQRAGVYAN